MTCTHSIMFHHFHDHKHARGQGSISLDEFEQMIDWLASNYNLIGAREYLVKYENANLKNNDICLSFDDALLCQYDIAIPVLEKFQIDAFFFIYSCVFTDKPDNLEMFRYFRNNYFTEMDDFFKEFFNMVEEEIGEEIIVYHQLFKELDYLIEFPFYTENDKWFRYLRDQVLGNEKYEDVLFRMMAIKQFSPNDVVKKLWMTEDHVKDIYNKGHSVGLHSFNHPIPIDKLNYHDQLKEYQHNLEHLTSITGKIDSMSHPYGSYNDDTLKILNKLGIRIGFRSNFFVKEIKSKFEIPREDHMNIFKAMKQ